MKKIAISGYSSAVGRYFTEKYKDEYQFVRIGRKDPDVFLDLSQCDTSDEMEKLRGCDALVNFAADTRDGSDDEILGLVKANVVGTLFLCQLANRFDIPRFIHTSSISATYDATDPYYNYYAESKRSADAFVTQYCEKNDISYCILRPASLFGTADFLGHQKLLYTLVEKVRNKQNVEIYGRVDAKRNYIHVDTLCEIVSKLIEHDSIMGVYDVVNTKSDRMSEIVQALNDVYCGSSIVTFKEDEPDIIERDFETDGEIYKILNMKEPRGIKDELGKRKELLHTAF